MSELYCTICKEPITPKDRRCPRCNQPAVLLELYWLQQRNRLGQGGFGVVYEARHLRTSVRCAVKELPRLDEDDSRMRAEVEALVHISHFPFVPKIYDRDDLDPACYYIIMEFVSGPTIDRLAREHWTPARVEEFLRIMLANLALIHDVGLFHRDIKPQNIKYTDDRRYVLLDFGLAKRATDDSTVRALTVLYAPPEQLRHEGTDARTDLFSLGVTVYQLLTGKTPPNAEERLKGYRLPLPSEIEPNTPPNLERTLLKLMELERDDRPSDARAALALLNPDQAAEDGLQASLDAQFEQAPHGSTTSRPTLNTQPEIARQGKGRILGMAIASNEQTMALTTPLGTYLYNAQTFEEWRLIASSPPMKPPVFIGTGQQLAVVLEKGVRCWRVHDGALLPGLPIAASPEAPIAFAADGTLIAIADETGLTVRRLGSAAEPQSLAGLREIPQHMVFSPDSTKLAASAGSRVMLWQVADGVRLPTVHDLPAQIDRLAWSNDGVCLLVVCDSVVHIRRVADGQTVRAPLEFGARITTLAVATSAPLFAVAVGAGVRICRYPDGAQVHTLADHLSAVHTLAFASAGQVLFSASAEEVRCWNTNTAEQSRTLQGHWNRLQAVAFAPDSQRLVAMGGTVFVWEIDNGQFGDLRIVTGHQLGQNSVAFSPDSQVLACASRSGVTLLRAAEGEHVLRLDIRPSQAKSLAFLPAGNRLAIVAKDLDVRDAVDGGAVYTISLEADKIIDVTLAENGALAAVVLVDAIQFFDLADGSMLRKIEATLFDSDTTHGEIKSAHIAADGALIAIVFAHTISIWQIEPLMHRFNLNDQAQHVIWSVDGTKLAVLHDQVIWLYRIDSAVPRRVQIFDSHAGYISDATFSGDGKLLASVSHDGTLRLWNVE